MMKAALIATAGLLAFWPAANAAEVRFRGAFTITSVKNCMARYVGETFNSAFRPASVGDNPNVTSLTQLNQYSGDAYELAGAAFPLKEWVAVEAHGVDYVGYDFTARIFIDQQSPARITARTNFVLLRGVIENMGNDPGSGGVCVAGFRGAYFRRVD